MMGEEGRATARSGHGDLLVAVVHTEMEMTGRGKSRVRGLGAGLWVREAVRGCQPRPVTGWLTREHWPLRSRAAPPRTQTISGKGKQRAGSGR